MMDNFRVYNSVSKSFSKLSLHGGVCVICLNVGGSCGKTTYSIEGAISDIRREVVSHYLSYMDIDHKIVYIHNFEDIPEGYSCLLQWGSVVIADGIMYKDEDHEMASYLISSYGREILRWVVLRHRYRASIYLSNQLLRDNLNIMKRFYEIVGIINRERMRRSVSPGKNVEDEFKKAMNNDFDTPSALSLLIKYMKKFDRLLSLDGSKDYSIELQEKILFIGRRLGLLNIDDPSLMIDSMLELQQRILNSPKIITRNDIESLIEQRSIARSERKFEKADHICNVLRVHGIEVSDNTALRGWSFSSR